jgi:hypothetical protein
MLNVLEIICVRPFYTRFECTVTESAGWDFKITIFGMFFGNVIRSIIVVNCLRRILGCD